MKCLQCGKETSSDQAKYCHVNCRAAYRRAHKLDYITKNCVRCGKEFSHDKNRHPNTRFCSQRCSGLEFAIKKNEIIEWNGNQYQKRTADEYFGRLENGIRHLLHRDIWEHHNGPIPAGMMIHHKDENPANNAIHNLALVSAGEHNSIHWKMRKEKQKRTGLTCANCGTEFTAYQSNAVFCSPKCGGKFRRKTHQ